MEVEVAIRLLYMLGEALPASHGAHFSGDVAKASTLQAMMRTVRVLQYPFIPIHNSNLHLPDVCVCVCVAHLL